MNSINDLINFLIFFFFPFPNKWMTSRTTIKLTTTRIRREEDRKRKGPDKI